MKIDYLKGGEFLTVKTDDQEIFIPEEFTDEQKMIADVCEDFLEKEVYPNLDRIDKQEPNLMVNLLKKAGELGLLSLDIPEEYGGLGQSFVTSMLAADKLGGGHSFAVAYSAHTGIGTLPILYYGNEYQKQKYLPKLATGEWLAAYCLTEPGAGSDANSGRTRATLSSDGKYYILNGQKMWITNGGFADVLVVFAKIENDKILSAFIVERNFPGITFGAEENKMGIKGSSTVQIFFNDCQVPVENLLGKRGEGFRIALNILHIGRIKLGADVIGSMKRAILHSVNYANERKQFGTLIANFGAIKYKLAEQVVLTFATESAVYRVADYIDRMIENQIKEGKKKEEAQLSALGEYAMEAAILKVYGSEALDYIVDEGVQIHGGMGFSSEMPIERCYRDSRINRIFEGTNEINRLVIADHYLKLIKKPDSPIIQKAKELYSNINNIQPPNPALFQNQLDYFSNVIDNFKNLAILLQFKAYETLEKKYNDSQEILMALSNIIMQIFVLESSILRIKKLKNIKTENEFNTYLDLANVLINNSANEITVNAREIINSLPLNGEYQSFANLIFKLTNIKTNNILEARRNIANKIIEHNKYCF